MEKIFFLNASTNSWSNKETSFGRGGQPTSTKSVRVCLEKTFPKIQQNKKRKRKGLAHMIAQSTDRTTPLGEVVHNTMLEKALEETGELEHGEINCPVSIPLLL